MAENEKLDCLRKLQDVLQEKFRLERQLENLPKDLRNEENILRNIEKEFSDLQQLASDTVDEVKSLSIRYEDAFQVRTGYEKQMEFLNTQREYEALSKQLEEARANEETLLKQRNSKTKESEKLRKQVEEKEADVNAQREKVAAEQAKVDTQLSGINEKIADLDRQCLEIKGCVISDELFPMQFVIDLRLKQEKNEIDYCPYCSRIIWYEALDPETEKSFIFEQLESKGTGSESKAASSSHDGSQDADSYDESMGMDEGFEDF